jgi:hypothetical protein
MAKPGVTDCGAACRKATVAACLVLVAAGAWGAPGEVVERWGFETGTEGWTPWSTVPMTQEARGRAHGGKAALWGEVRERGPLVHSRGGLDVPVAGTRLSFWYFVPRSASFEWFEINLRTREGGERMYQMARGLKRGSWQRLEVPLAEFFGWLDRERGFHVRQFEVTVSGVGALALDDVELSRGPEVKPEPPPGPAEPVKWVPDDPPARCVRDSATKRPGRGAIRTAQVGGRWFLIDADGNLFHSLACNAMMHAAYWSDAYDQWVKAHYASDNDWEETTCRRLFGLGFNSSSGGLLPAHRRRNMPYFAGRCLTWAGPHVQDGAGNTAIFPDVFDPAWQAGAEQWVREDVAAYGDDRLLAGYWTDNEIQMHQPLSHGLGLMGWFWAPGTAKELARWLGDRYGGDIQALNRRWSSAYHTYSYAGFDGLPGDKPEIRGEDDPVAPDLRDFVRHMLKTYVDTIVGLYHRYDPRHPVCTNRFAGQFDVSFADLLKPYDIIACNSYPRDRWDQREFSAEQLAWLRAMHAATGRPVLVSEWSVMSSDAGLPNFWGRVATQQARGEAYRRVLGQLWAEKYVVGAHWFSWVDSTDAEASNFGIVDACDRDYAPLAEAMGVANRAYTERVREWKVGE